MLKKLFYVNLCNCPKFEATNVPRKGRTKRGKQVLHNHNFIAMHNTYPRSALKLSALLDIVQKIKPSLCAVQYYT